MAVTQFNSTLVDLSDNTTLVSDFDSIVYSVHVTTVTSAQALPIHNGSAAGDNLITLAASSAVGTLLEFGEGVRFPDGIFVDPDDAATGVVTISWKPNR